MLHFLSGAQPENSGIERHMEAQKAAAVPRTAKGTYPKGTSGNLKGKPKGCTNKVRPMSDRAALFIERLYPKKLKEEIEQHIGEKLPKDFSYGDAAIMGLGLLAAKGDTGAARELREAIEGKARQRIELGGFTTNDEDGDEEVQGSNGDGSITLRIVYDKDKQDPEATSKED